ncbi:MAG: hypothetical protein KDC44_17700, partial [Phaeodactylibacter sp.]|nr:hypothetical protein [Phaeodactylibacter sp.]
MCKRILFFATALVLIGLAASGFTSTSTTTSWKTGGKNVMILGEATPLALDFSSPHELLRLPTEAAFATTIEDRIRRADVLFMDECQFADAAAFAAHPFVQAAAKVGTPIVLENASADAVSGVVGAGFGGAVVVLQTVNETTAQLTIIQDEEHLEAQIRKALVKADAFRLKHAAMPVGDGDILPNYSKRTIYADIASPAINFQRKLCQDEETLHNAQSQSGQLDVGVKIDLYAFMEAKIAVFSATGSGIYAGQHLIRNDDQFRGIFIDSAYFQLAHNGPELQFTHTAPINAMASETVNTQTSFGITSGPKGIPIPTFNKTTTITQTLDAFGVFNRSSS